MKAIIYSMRGCGYCTKMKEVMKRADIEYEEKMLHVNITHEEYFDKEGPHPGKNNFPQLVIDGQLIGGLTDTVRYLVENKLLTKKSLS